MSPSPPRPVPTDRPSEPRIALKHNIYVSYSQCWMGKICQTPSWRPTLVDAYGGAGRYPDGAEGSPIRLARAYKEHVRRANFGPLRMVCGDVRADIVEELERNIRPLEGDGLSITVSPARPFAQIQSDIARSAHGNEPGSTPVLWVLDPVDWKTLPFDVVRACATSGPRDDVIVTFFAGSVRRFLAVESHARPLTRYFGDDRWRSLVPLLSRLPQVQMHNKICETYEEALKGLGLYTGRFGIATRGEAPLYYLVCATHNPAGLECWQAASWRLDPVIGAKASEKRVGQLDFFETPILEKLRPKLMKFAGTEQPWASLLQATLDAGFKETHLRQVLEELADEGLAARVAPAAAGTPWPEGCVVRIFREEDVRAAREALDLDNGVDAG